jgi:hypothetical protein
LIPNAGGDIIRRKCNGSPLSKWQTRERKVTSHETVFMLSHRVSLVVGGV